MGRFAKLAFWFQMKNVDENHQNLFVVPLECYYFVGIKFKLKNQNHLM